ncbi:MAG: hypothetical protein ACI4SJ_03305 [Candidatus Avispirillum sp.]
MPALVLCLSLVACGFNDPVVGDDWRVTGVVRDGGTVTRGGEDTVVLVCVYTEDAVFYYDSEDQVVFDSVNYPSALADRVALSGDVWGMFKDIDFDDLNGDGNSDVTMRFDDSGSELVTVWIWDPEEGYVFQEDLSILTTNSGDIGEYVGLWEYVDENLWLRIYDDATWEFINDQEDVTQSGALWVEATGITLHFEDTGDVMQLDRAESGDLLDSVNNGVFVPVDSIRSRVPYFTRNGLEINAAMDKGTYLLKDGVCTYANFGDGYNTADCYWEVTKNYDYTHDGIRELQFDAICYIPRSSIGTFNQKYVTNTNSELYDFYSGMWLTAATSYGNSNRGENYYLHTIEWNGQSETIEFAYSIDWQENVGDWGKVLTKSYVAYLPEGYDGLIFAAEPQTDNYKDCAKAMQLDSIMPEASIMDIDLIDPYGCLFFNICN